MISTTPNGKTLIQVWKAPLSANELTHFVLECYIDNFTQLCVVIVDLSHLPLEPLISHKNETYYHVKYDVVLMFGLTEVTAQVAWKEDVSFLLECNNLELLSNGTYLTLFRASRSGKCRSHLMYIANTDYCYYRSAAKIVYDPDV